MREFTFCTRKLLNNGFNINGTILGFGSGNRNVLRMFAYKFEILIPSSFFYEYFFQNEWFYQIWGNLAHFSDKFFLINLHFLWLGHLNQGLN